AQADAGRARHLRVLLEEAARDADALHGRARQLLVREAPRLATGLGAGMLLGDRAEHRQAQVLALLLLRGLEHLLRGRLLELGEALGIEAVGLARELPGGEPAAVVG